jgi:hypothetical protein
MTGRRATAVSLIGIALAGAGLIFAMQTTIEFDGKTDFSRFKTWSWGPDQPATGNPVAAKRVREAVEAQLAQKGWTLAETGPGDAVVAANGVVRDDENLDVLYSGWAPGWGWGSVGIGTGVGTTVQTRVKSGTLIIDIFDAATKKLVWRGTAEDTLEASTTSNEKKIDQAVQKLFKRFPPVKPEGPQAP